MFEREPPGRHRAGGRAGRAAMSPPGRPKGEFRSAQHEGSPVSAHGRSKALTPEHAVRRVVQ